MDNQWKEETCKTCDFAMGWEEVEEFDEKYLCGSCRKHPPSNSIDNYPPILESTLACSCWREKQ